MGMEARTPKQWQLPPGLSPGPTPEQVLREYGSAYPEAVAASARAEPWTHTGADLAWLRKRVTKNACEEDSEDSF